GTGRVPTHRAGPAVGRNGLLHSGRPDADIRLGAANRVRRKGLRLATAGLPGTRPRWTATGAIQLARQDRAVRSAAQPTFHRHIPARQPLLALPVVGAGSLPRVRRAAVRRRVLADPSRRRLTVPTRPDPSRPVLTRPDGSS